MKANIFLACLALPLSAFAERDVLNEPYGVCAHVSRGHEKPFISSTFEMGRDAGITWYRTDFDWNGMERRKGEWTFGHIDSMMEEAKKRGVKILPILVYSTSWARPAFRHLGEWENYVRTVVGRYKGDLRHWEVYNEPNLPGFWGETPAKGSDYAKLLELSYGAIKAADPDLKVLYAGVAGVPLSYIEDSFKAGAAAHFDIMNVHPYQWGRGLGAGAIVEELRGLKKLMEKYGAGGRPIWITEVGWPTPSGTGDVLQSTLAPALKRAGIDPARSACAAVSDPDAGYAGVEDFGDSSGFKGFKEVCRIKLSQIKNLDAAKYPVLVPSQRESFPGKYMDDLAEYVRRGGTILFAQKGLPLYYASSPESGGAVKRVPVGDRYLRNLRVGYDVWWQKEGVPKKESYQKPAPEFAEMAGGFKFRKACVSGRFLSPKFLSEGDEFIPIIEAGDGDYKSAVAAIYKLKGMGNVIVYTNVDYPITELEQARNLPAAYIASLANGVDRIFWYNFRAAERDAADPESHFGVVHRDLSPKPAYKAWKTLSKMCPDKSSRPSFAESNGAFLSGWTRPDGSKIWALWAERERKVSLKAGAGVKAVCGFMGNPLPAELPSVASKDLVYIECGGPVEFSE